MEILEIKENEDGSCDMECKFTEEEVNLLLNYAVVNILREKIKDIQEEIS